MKNIADGIIGTVGNTPLVKLIRMDKDLPGNIFAKIEARNPCASVKDRIALAMIEEAEQSGRLKPGDTIVEPTSGNTGIGLAFVAAAKGYKAVFTMPDSMSIERRKIQKAFGAQLVLTPREKGMKGAIAKAVELAEENGWVHIAQFDNPANPEVHRRTTAEEIWNDIDGEIDVFVAGVGTGGTVTGVGEVLKAKKPGVLVVAVEPVESPVLSGGDPSPHPIQGIGPGFVPSVLNTEIYDEIIQVNAPDSRATVRDMAKKEGILGGISCGAAMKAALEVASRKEMEGKNIVVVLPDFGERYLSTDLFDDTDA